MTETSPELTALLPDGTAPRAQTPNLRPRDAASLILVDRSRKAPRVLMGRRHPGHRFMPDVFVFPGGRVEASDRAMPVFGMLDGDSERRLMTRVQRPSPLRARALAAAAIRETFEETGLMLGTTEAGPPDVPSEDWQAFATHGVYPNLESLTFMMRAITPPRRIKRFDTRFFLADVSEVAARVEGVAGPDAELVELRWLTLPETEKLELPNITRIALRELAARLEARMPRRLPVPFYTMRHGTHVRAELD
ncbi:NUDIX hydrolase [Azorhizobium oxalatiphilum]|uniref:NUDIX hydrolase n=1 Tax=Azorhizobium oxalatiphilum TaxID=980631 RepID=A0A917BTA6_9HYPH|nr:NUDIX domain-containing protein [Azorhizobium oxalatiphilum]GGF55890.1 NUDIX hydrolase [Azorhizobium oxalatiphilum]